jgi:hypothetical protein
MSQSTRLEWLERATALVLTLNRQILSSQPQFVAMNLDGIYSSIAQQEATCSQLHLHFAGVNRDFADTHSEESRAKPDESERHRKLLTEFLMARADLQQLNRTQDAFLRRSGRNSRILLNALGVQNPTYTLAEIAGTSGSMGMR